MDIKHLTAKQKKLADKRKADAASEEKLAADVAAAEGADGAAEEIQAKTQQLAAEEQV